MTKSYSSLTRLSIIGWTIVLLMGCGGPSNEKKTKLTIEQNQASARSQLARYEAIHLQLAEDPPLAGLTDDAKALALNFNQDVDLQEMQSSLNAAIVSQETLKVALDVLNGTDDTDLGSQLRFVNHPGFYLLHCAQALQLGAQHPDVLGIGWTSLEVDFLYLKNIKHLIVVRAEQFQEPEITTFGPPAEFKTGLVVAEAVLCDLENNKILGRVRFDATNSADVTSYNQSTTSDAEQALRKNLEARADYALHQVLISQFSNTVFPDYWKAEE